MARKLRDDPQPARAAQPVDIPHDPVNEAAVIAAAALDREARAALVRRVRSDQFVTREGAEAWAAIEQLERRGLDYSRDAVEKLAGRAAAERAEAALGARGRVENVAWHVENLLWDSVRAGVARGSLPAFLDALRDPRTEPERVRALARGVAASFDGYQDRRHMHEPGKLVRDQMAEVENRLAGHASYPFGIDGLDWHDKLVDGRRRRRMIPGTAPGEMTCVTAVSGGGKSTFTAHVALGIAGLRSLPGGKLFEDPAGRGVLFGAWEMRGGMTLELMACLSLGWSRSDLMDPEGASDGSPVRTHEGRVALEDRMHAIGRRVKFLGIPFFRQAGKKPSNERNLDIVQGYIADSGCDVFIADLWKRCLHAASPEDEEDALIRQQAMAEEQRVHVVLLQQQRLKDIENRPDKRPTREGIKGSGAWVEAPDTIIGIHRPGLWQDVGDSKLEVIVMKQRYGKWPLAVEFDWDADTGAIWGGRSVDYKRPGEASELDSMMGAVSGGKRGKGWRA